MIDVRIGDVLKIVEEHPCSTVKEIVKLLDVEYDSRSYNDRLLIYRKVDEKLRTLRKQGHVESISTSPLLWRLLGSDATRDNFDDIKRLVTLNGECKSLRAWCIALGMKDSTVRMRIKRGWSVERALTTPARKL